MELVLHEAQHRRRSRQTLKTPKSRLPPPMQSVELNSAVPAGGFAETAVRMTCGHYQTGR
jgi:hypothetical protein